MIRQLYTKSEQLSKIDLTIKTLQNVFDTFVYVLAVLGFVWFYNHFSLVISLLKK